MGVHLVLLFSNITLTNFCDFWRFAGLTECCNSDYVIRNLVSRKKFINKNPG